MLRNQESGFRIRRDSVPKELYDELVIMRYDLMRLGRIVVTVVVTVYFVTVD